jgi:predicted MPP superfamily phosphohydrolase
VRDIGGFKPSHTHGGQVRFPVLGATVVPSRYGHRYAAGLFQVENTLLYVTRSLGTVRFPIRFLCRPELALFTLRRRQVSVPLRRP